jgi:hypothetical protein
VPAGTCTGSGASARATPVAALITPKIKAMNRRRTPRRVATARSLPKLAEVAAAIWPAPPK